MRRGAGVSWGRSAGCSVGRRDLLQARREETRLCLLVLIGVSAAEKRFLASRAGCGSRPRAGARIKLIRSVAG